MIIFLATLAYGWTCVRFHAWIVATDGQTDPDIIRYSWFWSVVCMFWPLVMLLGMYLSWRDMAAGLPR